LQVVRRLIPATSAIARSIVKNVENLYPNYQCLNGCLADPVIQTSSLRDTEMFQVYLWVCILEGNIQALQDELFPLCVMLYPKLKVSWDLVHQLINMLGVAVRVYLTPEQMKVFKPYHQALLQMFSADVFPS
jgi:hypothetical protein